MNILADESLPGLQAAFPKPFHVSTYAVEDEIPALLKNQDVLLCRSTLKVTAALLGNHPLKYLATASSGTDHLDHAYLQSRSIQTIDAKGANANAVADYVIASLAWLDSKKLIKGNKAGIIGMGQVGSKVFLRLLAADYEVCTYDPLKTNFQSCELKELYNCDVLFVHAQLHHTFPFPSFNLINQQFLQQLKPGCIIINAARGGIINEQALLDNKQPLVYCTDVYLNEPTIDKRIVDMATLCTPHIAGHSLEAKYRTVALVSEQLHRIAKLPVPLYQSPLEQVLIPEKGISWQDLALSLYNPINETIELKNASHLESAFLNVRKNHINRHDFAACFDFLSPARLPVNYFNLFTTS